MAAARACFSLRPSRRRTAVNPTLNVAALRQAGVAANIAATRRADSPALLRQQRPNRLHRPTRLREEPVASAITL